ncbi:unnamed protein product [Bursaphelenchus xylophilus]|uniref:Eukaryotic translation initiation factor 3 subunit A n=1 Tax=Bursaphelenchus xylophilus TaxID=6326 RepID=A0A1I7S220_BURXY|nr:unnamed protein product [Bursaphelenchus xylophilus]CAG9090311.1 unnamed protein product [Bursaphelenchus xylophilus]
MNNRYSTVQRPEAALQRANDFISVGKEADALNALYEVIKDRRSRQWSETYEEIMMKYVELCVRLRNTALAKDGLFQYRVFTQQVSVTSLKSVIEHFLGLAEQKTEEAQKESMERVEEIDDLDSADAPENLLLSVVSGAVTQDRMDRTVLSPWLRFLWDSYRNCLDMLRNNVIVEEIYHWVARKSFEFCAKYKRRNEFRKLCDLLRIHLAQIQKSQTSVSEPRTNDYRVKLSSIDSLQFMQDTRLHQLNTAIQMELWQEAYKSAEDLHNIMQLSKDKDRRMVKPASYVNYFDKLAMIFWKGGNTLFHAAALLQKFIICKDMKKTFTGEEATDQATRVLLATLTIQDGADQPSTLTKLLDIEDQHLTNIRVLSSLLRLPIAPTRAGLLKEIAWLNIPELAIEPARQIYKNLELEFQPLKLASVIQGGIDNLNKLEKPEYSQYSDELKFVVATKVLRQLSIIYGSLSLSRFQKIIPFFSRVELEHFLVESAKHRSIKASVSHRDDCVVFSALDLTLAGGLDASVDVEAASNGIEYIREHLIQLHNHCQNAVFELEGAKVESEIASKLGEQVKTYLYHKDEDYSRILSRCRKIEDYKEVSEHQRREKIQIAQEEYQKREEQRRQAELRRLEEENQENEKKRQQAEKDEIVRRQKAEQLKRFQSNPIYQQIVKEKGEEAMQTMDPELVLKEQRERMDVERRELQNKLRQHEKKYDYVVRAFHLEEIKHYKKMSEDYLENAPSRFKECEDRRIQNAIEEHERSIQTYERMNKIRADAEEFLGRLIERNAEDLERRRKEWKIRLEEEKRRRLIERKEQRKVDRKRQEQQRKKEEEDRIKEQAERDKMEKFEKDRQDHRQMMERIREKERQTSGFPPRRDRNDQGGGRYGDRERNGPTDGDGGKFVPSRVRREVDFSRADTDSNWRRGGPPAREERESAPAHQESQPSSGAWVPSRQRQQQNQDSGSNSNAYRPPAARRDRDQGRAAPENSWR